jgi:hypothetical protein
MSIPYEKAVAEDLNLGHGTVSVTMPGGGSATGNKIGLHTFGLFFNAQDFGAVGDGSTDDTAALQACYTAAKAAMAPMYIPAGQYVFTSALTWDGYVSVIGAGRGSDPFFGTVLRKKGTFTGITIAPGGELVEYRDFVLDKHSTGAGGVGIEITVATSGLSMRNVTITNQGSHGLLLSAATQCVFDNVRSAVNGGDGIRLEPTGADYCNANYFSNIITSLNTGYGFNLVGGAGGTYANQILNLVTQNNTNYGYRSNDITNYAVIYSETNTAGDIILESGAVRNFVTLLNNSGGSAGVDDLGTNNWIFDFSNGLWRVASGISPIKRPTNVAGNAFGVTAGAAGDGAAGRVGGDLTLAGGDAAGTAGAAAGGACTLGGGAGINGGPQGLLKVQTAGGPVVVGATAVTSNGSLLELHSTTQAFCLTQVTTAQRDAITSPRNGMMVYNTSTSKINGYEGGAWVALT